MENETNNKEDMVYNGNVSNDSIIKEQINKEVIPKKLYFKTQLLNIYEPLKLLSAFCNEVTLKFNKEGFKVVMMDPANVEMTIINFSSSLFYAYNINQEMDLSLNMDSLMNFLKTGNVKKDFVSLEYSEDINKNNMTITLYNGFVINTTIPLLDLSEEKEQRIPDLKFNNNLKLNSKSFKEVIGKLSKMGESVKFSLINNVLELQTNNDFGETKLNVEAEILSAPGSLGICKYSLEYLKNMVSGYKISDNVTIAFNTDYPLIMEYKKQGLSFQMILAPRLEND